MKKLFIITAAALLLLLAACAAPAQAPVPEPAETAAPEVVIEPEIAAEPEPEEPVAEPEPAVEPEPEPAVEPEAEPVVEPEPEPEEPVDWPDHKNPTKCYYIKVNKTANTVTIYTYDENDEYSHPLKAMVCSTGPGTPRRMTVTMNRNNKYRWHGLWGNVYGQYCTHIWDNVLFHSVPYAKKDPGTLFYTKFDKLGTADSAGCIRLQVVDAKWIYDRKDFIETVEFYCDDDPGPLGKPEAPKISDNEVCRGWDPTDPDPENPWLTWTPEPEPVPEEPAEAGAPAEEALPADPAP